MHNKNPCLILLEICSLYLQAHSSAAATDLNSLLRLLYHKFSLSLGTQANTTASQLLHPPVVRQARRVGMIEAYLLHSSAANHSTEVGRPQGPSAIKVVYWDMLSPFIRLVFLCWRLHFLHTWASKHSTYQGEELKSVNIIYLVKLHKVYQFNSLWYL